MPGSDWKQGLKAALEGLRDRVVRGSQASKRKLDATFTRRNLDERLRELGERYFLLVEGQEGGPRPPAELQTLLAEIRTLEDKLKKEEADIAELETEPVAEKGGGG